MKFMRHILSFGLIFMMATVAFAQDDVIGVIYQTSNVRSGPDTRFPIVGQLSEGDRVPITGKNADTRWLRVAIPDGEAESGWLPVFSLIVEGDLDAVPVILNDAVSGTPVPNADVNVISYGRVNVRSGPGMEYDIVAQLDVDEVASAIARSNQGNDWLLIELDDDSEGWVAYFTVNVQGDPRALPVLVPDSTGDGLIPPSRLLRARFNVRLHTAPELASPVTITIPFDSEVTPLGRDARGSWLYVGFDGDVGWGAAQLFDVTADELEMLPVMDVDAPTRTPTPTATLPPAATDEP